MSIDWTKLPSLTALRSFDATARAKSFSGAARSLNVTHAAVAQQVRALEEHLGLQLLERSPQGVSLTSHGQELAQALATGFSAIEEGVNTLKEKDQNRPIRVTTTAYFAEAVIFPRMSRFWSAHPDVEVSFSQSDEAVDIVKEGFDVAVRAGEGDWPGLNARLLVESPTRAFAAPSLVDDPNTDWSKLPWLIPDNSEWERVALRESGIDIDSILTVDLGAASLEVRGGEEGMGLVLESELDLAPQVAAGTLKIAPVPITHLGRFFVVTPPWKPRAQVADFIKWLVSEFGS